MEKQLKKRRRMRCPKCNGYTTKKNGKRTNISVGTDRKTTKKVQRYICNNCKSTFTKRRDKNKQYSTGFKKEVIRMHVEERMSFRVISKRLKEKQGIKISAWYLCRLFNEEIMKVKSSLQIKKELSPIWCGYLIVDDKMINIKGDKKVSLIAKDKNGDIVHQELLNYAEQKSYDDFFYFIKDRLNYPFVSVTTDLDQMLEKSIKAVLPDNLPHQKCLKHTVDNIYKTVNYKALRVKGNKLEKKLLYDSKNFNSKDQQELQTVKKRLDEIEKMIKMIKSFLWGKEKTKTDILFKQLKRKYSKKYSKVISFLMKNKKDLLAHQHDEAIPKTNNDAENTNRQIKRRLKTIEAFQSINSAYNYLILFCNYLRMKPYTDCRKNRKYRNGKTPLELCGVKYKISDWVKYSLNYQ